MKTLTIKSQTNITTDVIYALLIYYSREHNEKVNYITLAYHCNSITILITILEVRDIAGPQDTMEVRDIAATLGRSRTRKCCDTESHCLGKS